MRFKKGIICFTDGIIRVFEIYVFCTLVSIMYATYTYDMFTFYCSMFLVGFMIAATAISKLITIKKNHDIDRPAIISIIWLSICLLFFAAVFVLDKPNRISYVDSLHKLRLGEYDKCVELSYGLSTYFTWMIYSVAQANDILNQMLIDPTCITINEAKEIVNQLQNMVTISGIVELIAFVILTVNSIALSFYEYNLHNIKKKELEVTNNVTRE